jgi:hypothetical protein
MQRIVAFCEGASGLNSWSRDHHVANAKKALFRTEFGNTEPLIWADVEIFLRPS